MPTYQYACTTCDHRFEAVQSFSDPALNECPECGGKVRKVFSSVGIVFKGSGFYRTDSRAGNGRGDAKAPSGSSDKGSSDKSSSGDSSSSSAGSSSSTTSSGPSSGSSDSKSSTGSTAKAS